MDVYIHVAKTLNLPEQKVRQALQLLDDGNTVPFIARYRKEATGGLDEVQIRDIAAAAQQYRTLEERKAEVLRLIGEQEKLTPELEKAITAATTQQAVEDLYRPYRPKRRTRAGVARERGLEPLAAALRNPGAKWGDIYQLATTLASAHEELEGPEAALAGASDIIAEQVADDADTRAHVRNLTEKRATLEVQCALPEERRQERTPYENYYDYTRSVSQLKPHAVLAINRGEREEVLKVTLHPPTEHILSDLKRRWVRARESQVAALLEETMADSYTRLLGPSIERELRRNLTDTAGTHAIGVFSRNLESLLMQPPIRGKRVLGVDPGYRTGCKLTVVDETGRLLATSTMYPHPPQNQRSAAMSQLKQLISKHEVTLVTIGNGTASRETEMLLAETLQELPDVHYLITSEAGASVYSASDLAREELPGLDVAMRGAVSIARRVQDPLAELVKVEPKAIGVGQYQHDVDQKALGQALHDVVESCVNRVGVHVNTASPALLQYVAGLSATLSRRIVEYRDENGAFSTRKQLLKVKGLGAKTFEQAAGFLRIPDGDMPLDGTAVHPESYKLAQQILDEAGLKLDELGEEKGTLSAFDPKAIAQKLDAGVPTVTDIIAALLRPGLDPRSELPVPPFRRDVLHMEDLRPGMRLTGTVSNVVDFGAFVDVGLKKAGLIHISKLGQGYVSHPLDVVSVGEPVEVEVLEVDLERGRIGLELVR